MTTEAFLNRDYIEGIEPEEADATGRTWLSGYAIPTAVEVAAGSGGIDRVAFRYPTPEVRAEPPTRVDDLTPSVSVTFATGVRRVLAVDFASGLAPTDLPAVADRLDRYAARELMVAKRLSVRLVATLLRRAAAGELGDWAVEGAER